MFKKRIVGITFMIAAGILIEVNTYALIRPTVPVCVYSLASTDNSNYPMIQHLLPQILILGLHVQPQELDPMQVEVTTVAKQEPDTGDRRHTKRLLNIDNQVKNRPRIVYASCRIVQPDIEKALLRVCLGLAICSAYMQVSSKRERGREWFGVGTCCLETDEELGRQSEKQDFSKH
ncbi:hypothetical protein Tco_0526274 [Tanacetum coccineum]